MTQPVSSPSQVQHISVSRFRHPNQTHDCVSDFSIDLRELNVYAIVGPSGCGKTSLLHAIANLYNYANAVFSPAQPTISYLFQEPRLMPWLTVRENISLVLPSGLSKAAQSNEVDTVLASVGILEKANDYPVSLSGGMQRRVAIARAFINKPDLLLLDEPFVSLDAPTAQECRGVLLALIKRFQCKVILVTHDLDEALYLGDKVVFLAHTEAKIIYVCEDVRDIDTYQSAAGAALKQSLLHAHPNLLSGIAHR